MPSQVGSMQGRVIRPALTRHHQLAEDPGESGRMAALSPAVVRQHEARPAGTRESQRGLPQAGK